MNNEELKKHFEKLKDKFIVSALDGIIIRIKSFVPEGKQNPAAFYFNICNEDKLYSTYEYEERFKYLLLSDITFDTHDEAIEARANAWRNQNNISTIKKED